MADLIDRQAAIKAIEDLHDSYNGFSDTYDKSCIIGVLEELPSAQPNLQPTCNQLATDCISRQAAIDFIAAGHLCNPNEPRWSDNEVVNFLKSRPSAQRTGRWIEDSGNIACSECHIIWLHRRTAFCPNCGADMRGEQDE